MRTRLVTVLLVLAIVLAWCVPAHAQSGLTAATGAAPAAVSAAGAARSVEGSTMNTDDCYPPGDTRTMCFEVVNASPDYEAIAQVRVTFPSDQWGDWLPACKSQDPTDSFGNPVNMSCSTNANEIFFNDNDNIQDGGDGEIASKASWSFCTDVTVPAGYFGPRELNWGVVGGGYGAAPHEETGTIAMPECTPVWLFPPSIALDGCAGAAQPFVFDVTNHTGSQTTYSVYYSVTAGSGTFTGPSTLTVGPGATEPLTATLTPARCSRTGTTVAAKVVVEDGVNLDDATVSSVVTATAGWANTPEAPAGGMDTVVAATVHDGGVWSVGGFTSQNALRYDPVAQTWSTHAALPVNSYEYPIDGCYGLDGDGHEVIVIFPDGVNATLTDIQRYDITADHWDTVPMPAALPTYMWGLDVVSMYNQTGENTCYLSGGTSTPGGGEYSGLWQYLPATNTAQHLGDFTRHPNGFNFHASWHVPWVGSAGAVCTAGGVDQNSTALANSQCYDLQTDAFRGVDADLGQLPEPWWGMADGWMGDGTKKVLWLANGVSQDGTLLRASASIASTATGFGYGPEPPHALYRGEGDGSAGAFYILQGSEGGFSSSKKGAVLSACEGCTVVTPCVTPLLLE